MLQLLNYTVQNLIGKGGMATVYLANHNTLNKPVAIKLLNKEYIHNENVRKRFLAEARNLFSLNHPNIIKVTDLIDDGETVAFVMEYMEGQTLKDYLDEKGKLSDEEIKKLFVQMLDAVDYVHEQGLIHRDIKPSNFMMTNKGLIKLLDFGIAKNTDSNSTDYTQTGTTQNMGTPMYMSPEQIKSTKDVTAQTDIYSLGVVLWQMVMGRKPYDTNTLSTFELQTKIVTENLLLTNSPFDDLITKATAKNLDDRYDSCLKLKNQLLNTNLNIFESTILNENKDSELTVFHEEDKDKSLVENEINNSLKNNVVSDSVVKKNISTKKPNSTATILLTLLVIGVIALLVFLSVQKSQSDFYEESYNSSDTPELTEETPSLYAPDSSSSYVFDTTSLINTKNIIFTNNSDYKAFIALGFWDKGGFWRSIGWFEIKSGENFTYTFPNDFYDDKVYWYAEADDGATQWSGKDGDFCIKEWVAFDINNSEYCASTRSFHKLILTGNYTYHSLSN
jgi:serine/threonine protein kinase